MNTVTPPTNHQRLQRDLAAASHLLRRGLTVTTTDAELATALRQQLNETRKRAATAKPELLKLRAERAALRARLARALRGERAAKRELQQRIADHTRRLRLDEASRCSGAPLHETPSGAVMLTLAGFPQDRAIGVRKRTVWQRIVARLRGEAPRQQAPRHQA